MILRARALVTMETAPIENGAVAIEAGRVVDVGRFGEVRERNSGDALDLGERALLPGLINAHCHLDYTCLRGKILRPQSFTDWIRAINAEKAKLSPGDYVRSIAAGFREAKRFGTTTIANLTAFPELIARVQSPIRCWWFAELIDLRAKVSVDDVIEQLKETKHWGLAPHAPFTASPELYKRSQQCAPLLTTHLAESREEFEMFCNARGPLYQFLKEIGRDMGDCGGKTPLEKFLDITGSSTALGSAHTDTRWMVVHLNELSNGDVDLLRRSTSRLSLVHCPRSHAYFGHSEFQFAKLRDLDLNVSLGTDSLASNDDLSLFEEMRAFQRSFPSVSPEEILRMTTINPARALQWEDALGKIAPGAHADFVAVPFGGRDLFEEIIAFDGEPLTVVGGHASEE